MLPYSSDVGSACFCNVVQKLQKFLKKSLSGLASLDLNMVATFQILDCGLSNQEVMPIQE